MKPIMMDMREMSLSKEVYDSRPNRFFAIFIYGLLAMALIALTWTYFGEIEIVVKSTGIIRPNTQIATVTNALTGEVTSVSFTDGQEVKQGDVLYNIDCSAQLNEKAALSDTIATSEHTLTALRLLHESIIAGENKILDFSAEHSAWFESYHTNLVASEHAIRNDDNSLSLNLKNYETTLEKDTFELAVVKLYKLSIESGADEFSSYDGSISESDRLLFNSYNDQYNKYIVDMRSLETQYNEQRLEIIQSTENAITTARRTIDGYSAIKAAISGGLDELPTGHDDIFSNKYNDYKSQIAQLTDKLNDAVSKHEQTASLGELGYVAENDVTAAEMTLETATHALDDYKTQFLLAADTEIENAQNTIDSILVASEGINSVNDLVAVNQRNKEAAIDKYRLDTLVSVNSRILELDASIESLNKEIESTKLQQEKIYLNGDEIANTVITRETEINKVLGQISASEQEILQLRSNLANIDTQIEEATVRAQIDGIVNTQTEIIKGSFLMSGSDVMSIIPMRDSMFNANLYVGNNDISGLSTGMEVKYDIYAMPRRDYGEISGRITRISADVSAAQDASNGYYLVEADILDKVYVDASGKEAELKVGMNFDASIVTGREKILFFLLEKLDMMLR